MVKERSKFTNKPDLRRLMRLKGFLRKPQVMTDLIKWLNVSERTVFRDFDRLAKDGFHVVRVGTIRPTQYVLHGVMDE